MLIERWSSMFVGMLVCAFLLGSFDVFRQLGGVRERISFARNFRHQFTGWRSTHFINEEIYEWLQLNSARMQQHVGSLGIMRFKPPFEQQYYDRYPVILNAISEIKKSVKNRLGNADDYADLINDTLLKHMGAEEFKRVKIRGEVWNPIILIRRGFMIILQFPIQVAKSFNLL
jgi:hypothetical protein